MKTTPIGTTVLPRRKRRSQILAVGLVSAVMVIGLGTTAATLSSTGCTTHGCDSSSYSFYGGHMLDENTFVTNDWDERWLDYPPNVTIFIYFPAEVAGRIPKPPIGNIGTGPTPNGGDAFVDGNNYTFAAGQLVYYNFLNTIPSGAPDGGMTGGGFWAQNATCTGNFARFEVDFVPIDEAGAGSIDGGATDGGGVALTPSVNDGAAVDATFPDAPASDAADAD
jgi:hypothetical protein